MGGSVGLECGTVEYHHKQKPNKVTDIREFKPQIRAFNRILKGDGMADLSNILTKVVL